jgi:hypothetical protein
MLSNVCLQPHLWVCEILRPMANARSLRHYPQCEPGYNAASDMRKMKSKMRPYKSHASKIPNSPCLRVQSRKRIAAPSRSVPQDSPRFAFAAVHAVLDSRCVSAVGIPGEKVLPYALQSVELRAPCNDSPQTPPGPEGSNGSGIASCAAEYPKFLLLPRASAYIS